MELACLFGVLHVVEVATVPREPDATGYHAFLSYSKLDRRRVSSIQRFLEKALRAAGEKEAKVYFDITDIRGGALPNELRRAVQVSRALIVCCSPAAKASRWVEMEIAAYTSARPDGLVIPVLLSGDPREAFPAGVDQTLRHHDLRRGIWFGTFAPSARDELLRIAALLAGSELRELINWDRRRLVKRAAGAAAAGEASGRSGGGHSTARRRRLVALRAGHPRAPV
jgi:hypothetical protein